MAEFVPTPHPVLSLPTYEQALAIGEAKLRDLLQRREELIHREKVDPLQYGYYLDPWKLTDEQLALPDVNEVLIMGGNRASKSEYAARKVVEKLRDIDGARVWCFQTSEKNSIEMQQPLVWKYLPPEWRNLKKGRITNISYTQKNGFSEGTFVCPNGSQCWFRNYEQDIETIEGGEIDLAWADELVPDDWLETLRYRLVTRKGILIVTFTPIQGWSATVKKYLSGAKTLVEGDAELLPNPKGRFEKVPLVQQPVRSSARIVYFHTKNNPYGGYAEIKKTLAGAGRAEILCRAYGVPTKAIANRFPKFSQKVHVLPASWIPKKGTNYHLVDPCSGRNWYQLWVRVDPRGRKFYYREWPAPQSYIEGVGVAGAWAEPDGKKADGRRGPAQQPFGFGLLRYKEEIERLEKDEEIFERFMDSRYGNTATMRKEAPITLIEECEEIDLIFKPTPGEDIDEGIHLVNDALDYDAEKPISVDNEPKMYVSEECGNLIYALQEWTGQDGRHGACKDPIDLLRYAEQLRLDYVGESSFRVSGGGAY